MSLNHTPANLPTNPRRSDPTRSRDARAATLDRRRARAAKYHNDAGVTRSGHVK